MSRPGQQRTTPERGAKRHDRNTREPFRVGPRIARLDGYVQRHVAPPPFADVQCRLAIEDLERAWGGQAKVSKPVY